MLGDEWLPVLPVEQFLSHLSDQRRSPNTVKAYAHDLKDYFDHFGRRGLAWDRLPYDELAAFKPWLRRGPPASHDHRPSVAARLRHRADQRRVRLEVVKQLLDHSSLEMSSHYARLLDTTIRGEWEAGRGLDDDYGHLLPTEVEWANRPRIALPNGPCALPRQQTCDHSNKCLPRPVHHR